MQKVQIEEIVITTYTQREKPQKVGSPKKKVRMTEKAEKKNWHR